MAKSTGKPADLSRAERKAKKRALEDAVPDLPGDGDHDMEDGDYHNHHPAYHESKNEADVESSDKKSKKRKRDHDAEDTEEEVTAEKKSKKDKKSKHSKPEEEGAADPVPEPSKRGKKHKDKEEKKLKKSKSKSQLMNGTPKELALAQKPKSDIECLDADHEMEDARKPKSDNKCRDADHSTEDGPEPAAEGENPKKSKKERKAERRAAEAALAAKLTSAPYALKPPKTKGVQHPNSAKKDDKAEKTEGSDAESEGEDKKSKKNNRNRDKKRKSEATGANGEGEDKTPARFIVFVGNLPYTANKESLMKHFASVQPKEVRVLTEKSQPTKCKGAAFVEFAGYDHMKTCLKLFHHSTFDDGKSAQRKINVELTAGGGGNTKERKAKIESKNLKLNEERARKMQEEEKAKKTKAAGGEKKKEELDESAIHPSRRRFVPGANSSSS